MSSMCPIDFTYDEVVPRRITGDRWEFTCERSHDGAGPFRWEGTNDPQDATRAGGGELEYLVDPLLSSMRRFTTAVEYDVVEWTFSQVAPAHFAELVRLHGHRRLDPRGSDDTASKKLVLALSMLRGRGVLDRVKDCPCTAPWRNQSKVSYWVLAGKPLRPLVSWHEYATAHGIDPAAPEG